VQWAYALPPGAAIADVTFGDFKDLCITEKWLDKQQLIKHRLCRLPVALDT